MAVGKNSGWEKAVALNCFFNEELFILRFVCVCILHVHDVHVYPVYLQISSCTETFKVGLFFSF